MRLLELLRSHSFELLAPILIFFITLVLGFLVRRLLFSALARWAKRTAGQFDDILVRAIRGPFMIWVLMLAIHLAAQVSPLPEKISGLIGKILLFLMVASLGGVAATTPYFWFWRQVPDPDRRTLIARTANR